MKIQIIYHLEHVYSWLNKNQNEVEEVKYIGAFSTIEKAKEAINYLSKKKGFMNHPVECFQIHKDQLDRFEWKDGFG